MWINGSKAVSPRHQNHRVSPIIQDHRSERNDLRKRYNAIMYEGLSEGVNLRSADPSSIASTIWSPPPQKESYRRERNALSPPRLGEQNRLRGAQPQLYYSPPPRGHRTPNEVTGDRRRRTPATEFSDSHTRRFTRASSPTDAFRHPTSTSHRIPSHFGDLSSRTVHTEGHHKMKDEEYPIHSRKVGEYSVYGCRSPPNRSSYSDIQTSSKRFGESMPSCTCRQGGFALVDNQFNRQEGFRHPQATRHFETFQESGLFRSSVYPGSPSSSRLAITPSPNESRISDPSCWEGIRCNAPPMVSVDRTSDLETNKRPFESLENNEQRRSPRSFRSVSTQEKSTWVAVRQSRSQLSENAKKMTMSVKGGNAILRRVAAQIIQQAWRVYRMRKLRSEAKKKGGMKRNDCSPITTEMRDVSFRSQSPPVSMNSEKGVPCHFSSLCEANAAFTTLSNCMNVRQGKSVAEVIVNCSAVCAFPGEEESWNKGDARISQHHPVESCPSSSSSEPNRNRIRSKNGIPNQITQHSPTSTHVSSLTKVHGSLCHSAFHIPGTELISDPIMSADSCMGECRSRNPFREEGEHMNSLIDSFLTKSRQKLALTYSEVRAIAACRIQAFWRGCIVRRLYNSIHRQQQVQGKSRSHTRTDPCRLKCSTIGDSNGRFNSKDMTKRARNTA